MDGRPLSWTPPWVLSDDPAAAEVPSSPSFVDALRAGLGMRAASSASLGAGTEIEAELSRLFHRCDHDASGSLGRAEFNHALQILQLDRHLELYGGEHGSVAGMMRLYNDLADESTGDHVVFFGLQYMVKEYLAGAVITEDKVDEAEAFVARYMADVRFMAAAGFDYTMVCRRAARRALARTPAV